MDLDLIAPFPNHELKDVDNLEEDGLSNADNLEEDWLLNADNLEECAFFNADKRRVLNIVNVDGEDEWLNLRMGISVWTLAIDSTKYHVIFGMIFLCL